MISKVIQIMNINPNKDISILPISIKLISDTNENEELPCVGPGKVGIVPLDPPGPVSLYLWHTHSEFRAGNFLIRKTILRETIVTLHERFENELKGRQWTYNGQRKKAIEQLEQQESSAISPNQHTPELNKALCYVLGFQFAEVDEIHKKIFWYPSDIRTWTKDQPIYLVSLGSRSVYIHKNEEEARNYFVNWLMDLENNNYTCFWPLEEGTIKDMKNTLEKNNLTLPIDNIKPKKEDYQILLGKVHALRHIHNEFTNNLQN